MVIASFVSYAMAKASAKNPEEFGKGADGGVVAAEAANNATVGGALIRTEIASVPVSSPLSVAVSVMVCVPTVSALVGSAAPSRGKSGRLALLGVGCEKGPGGYGLPPDP